MNITQESPSVPGGPVVDGVRLPLPSEMIAEVSRHVIGQDRAKRALTGDLYRHYILQFDAWDREVAFSFRPGRILLTGPTGVGKTLLVQTLAKFLRVPFAYISATTLSRTGYIGRKPEDDICKLLDAAGGDAGRAEKGLVFVDEIDKLKRNDDTYGIDVSGYGAQIDLLPYFDGADVTVVYGGKNVYIDTRRVFIVAAGAFAGVERVVERRLKTSLNGSGQSKGLAADQLVAQHLTSDDLIEYGLCEELLGRITTICPLDPLDAETLKAILLQAEGSPLVEAKAFYDLHGIELELDEKAIEAMVARALSERAGARALRRIVAETLADVGWQLPELAEAGAGVVTVTEAGGRFTVRAERARSRRHAPTRAEQLRARHQLAGGGGATSSPPAVA